MGTATYSPYVINLEANHVARGELAGCTHFSPLVNGPSTGLESGIDLRRIPLLVTLSQR